MLQTNARHPDALLLAVGKKRWFHYWVWCILKYWGDKLVLKKKFFLSRFCLSFKFLPSQLWPRIRRLHPCFWDVKHAHRHAQNETPYLQYMCLNVLLSYKSKLSIPVCFSYKPKQCRLFFLTCASGKPKLCLPIWLLTNQIEFGSK